MDTLPPTASGVSAVWECVWEDAVRLCHACHSHQLKSGPKDMGLISLKEQGLETEFNHMVNDSINHTYLMKPQ